MFNWASKLVIVDRYLLPGLALREFLLSALVFVLGMAVSLVPSLHAALDTPGANGTALLLPTSSILLTSSDITGLRAAWADPSPGYQSVVLNSVVGTANLAFNYAVPASLADTQAQASIVQAKVLRWLVVANNNTASQDFVDIKNILTNYAKATGGSSITHPLASKGYLVAYDFINIGLTLRERTTILNRLNAQVIANLGTPTTNNNQTFINYGTRGLYALLAGDTNSLNNLRTGFNAVTTTGGFFTDGNRYLNYTLGSMTPFLHAYKNFSGNPAGVAQYAN